MTASNWIPFQQHQQNKSCDLNFPSIPYYKLTSHNISSFNFPFHKIILLKTGAWGQMVSRQCVDVHSRKGLMHVVFLVWYTVMNNCSLCTQQSTSITLSMNPEKFCELKKGKEEARQRPTNQTI